MLLSENLHHTHNPSDLCYSIPGMNVAFPGWLRCILTGKRSPLLGHLSSAGLPAESFEEGHSEEEGGNSSRENWVVWLWEHCCPTELKGLKQDGALNTKKKFEERAQALLIAREWRKGWGLGKPLDVLI